MDDKIIARANQLAEDPLALAQRFIAEFHADMVGGRAGERAGGRAGRLFGLGSCVMDLLGSPVSARP